MVKGNQGEHWVNGIKVTEYELAGNQWTEDVKASNYANNGEYKKRIRLKSPIFREGKYLDTQCTD